MIFGNPTINIRPVDESEELVAIFGYNENSEVLVTNKRIYQNSKDEFVANETIIGLDSVAYTNFRYYHKKENRVPWIGCALLLFAAILLAFALAFRPYVHNEELREFLFPILYVLAGIIAAAGIALVILKLSKPAMPKSMPKGVIYIHYGESKPFRIFIFDGDLEKIREAHYRINDAIDRLKRFGKRDSKFEKKL